MTNNFGVLDNMIRIAEVFLLLQETGENAHKKHTFMEFSHVLGLWFERDWGIYFILIL